MALALKNRRARERGQTTVEYLLLLAAAFVTSYVVITGPFARFTIGLINNVKNTTSNIVRNGELTPEGQEAGTAGHPTDRARLKPLHL